MEKCIEFCPLAESVESVGSLLKETFLVEFLLTSDSDRSGEEANVCWSQIQSFLLCDLAKNTTDSSVHVDRSNEKLLNLVMDQ